MLGFIPRKHFRARVQVTCAEALAVTFCLTLG